MIKIEKKELSKGIRIMKLLKQVMDDMKGNMSHHSKGMNITGTQGMLMGILIHHGNMKISDLSEKIGLSNSTVSGIVDRLEKQGCVERVRSKEDRRVIYVNITKKHKEIFKKSFIEMEKKYESILNKANPEEIDKIFEGLDILQKLLHNQNKSDNNEEKY